MWRSSVQLRRRVVWYSSQFTKRLIRDGQARSSLVVGLQPQFRSFVSRRKGVNFEDPTPVEDDDDDLPELSHSPDDMDFFDTSVLDDSDDEEEEDEERAAEEERQKIRDELDSRTGRLWSDSWEITDEDWGKLRTMDDFPDWTPDLCSRVSLERVQIYKDGIPTLSTLANMALPPPAPPHPGHGEAKAYAKVRRRMQYQYVERLVVKKAEPQIEGILKLGSWQEKQDAVDELFETVEFELKEEEPILAQHPGFGEWVERSLESYLRTIQPIQTDGEEKATDDAAQETANEEASVTGGPPSRKEDAEALPIFVDLYDKSDEMVPKILHPLKPHPQDGPGRMVEEWELSAHKKTKRIMLRQCARQVAQLLGDMSKPVRVYVAGRRGVGKTAALATIVGSARSSGCIVLYMPDGDRLRKNFYYIEPSTRRKGMFDLPILSQEVCTELLTCHESDMEGMVVDSTTVDKFFGERELKKLSAESTDNISVVELLQEGRDRPELAPMCFSAVVYTLMNQTEKDFVIVADEFNCYYDHGHYFHMEYDESVRKAIPCHKINLLEPILNGMAISTATEESESSSSPVVMKRGGIVVGLTESHAVARKFTDALTASAAREAADTTSDVPLHVVDVPRFSSLEVEHIVSNFEATGIGRLRFDRGETVMNHQEVSYINMVSGGVGQNLLDECIL